jgi:hypothetical protein
MTQENLILRCKAMPFSQVVDCQTYPLADSGTYDYQDYEDASVYPPYWYVSWIENQQTTTYNCLGNQIGDPTTNDVGDGTYACVLVNYSLSCDEDGNEIEDDEYQCTDGDQSTDELTGWYYTGYVCD